MFLWEDISIDFRNPIEFVNQWKWFSLNKKLYTILIWLIYLWKRNDCDVWIKYGIRIVGIEIVYTKYLSIKRRNK